MATQRRLQLNDARWYARSSVVMPVLPPPDDELVTTTTTTVAKTVNPQQQQQQYPCAACFQRMFAPDDAIVACSQHVFDSNEGFVALEWGRLIWILMHIFALWSDTLLEAAKSNKEKIRIALAYRQRLCSWINGLTMVLMCATCRQRFELYVAAHPLEPLFEDLTQSCVNISFHLHNAVNCKLDRECLSESQYPAMREAYARMLTTLLSNGNSEWRVAFWTVLFLLSLNFPAHFNPQLPRYRALDASYREWILQTCELIPEEGGDSIPSAAAAPAPAPVSVTRTSPTTNGFGKEVCDALHLPFKRYSSAVAETTTTTTTTIATSPSYLQFLQGETLTRDRLFHWVFDLSTQVNRGVSLFGDCHATHQHFETSYRYAPTTVHVHPSK